MSGSTPKKKSVKKKITKKKTSKKAAPKKSKPEKRMKAKKQAHNRTVEMEIISSRAVVEWPNMRNFNQALRHLEVFNQLMNLGPFIAWMKDNVEIRDEIDDERKTLDTFVIYKGPGPLDGDGTDPDAPKSDPEQNIVQCPGCRVTFDSNVEVSSIVLSTEIPADASLLGSE